MVKAYVAAGLSVITKGPIGILLPGLILLLFVCIRLLTNRIHTDYSITKDLKLLFNPFGIFIFILSLHHGTLQCTQYTASNLFLVS